MKNSARMIGFVLALLSCPAAGQLPGVVDYTPEPPPNAAWPEFIDVAPSVGNPGTNFADPGAGRGIAWVDVVGRDPLDWNNRNLIGPSDPRLCPHLLFSIHHRILRLHTKYFHYQDL